MLNLRPGFARFTFLLLLSLALATNPAIAQDVDDSAKAKPAIEPAAVAKPQGPFGGGRQGAGGFGGGGAFDDQLQARREVQADELIISWSADNDELRGFSVKLGKWAKLPIPKQKRIVPVVAGDVAAVRTGDRMAGYSPHTGRWDVLMLSKGSKAVPVVRTGLVQVRDGEHSYTFAASAGRWTSPTDDSLSSGMRSIMLKHLHPQAALKQLQEEFESVQVSVVHIGKNRLDVWGTAWKLDVAEQQLKEIDTPENAKLWNTEFDPETKSVPSTAPGQTQKSHPEMPRIYPGSVGRGGYPGGPGILPPNGNDARKLFATPHPAEQQSLSLAQSLRKGDGVSDEQKQELRELVKAALDAKLQQQTKQVEQLRTKLQRVERQLEARQESRERIIERRVEELLDPEIDWQSLSGVPSTQSVPGISRTPIGLPGPPHLPLGQPARVVPEPNESSGEAADEALKQHIEQKFGKVNKPDDSSNIVEKLINRRREAERGLRRLQDSLQTLNNLRTRYADIPESNHQYEYLTRIMKNPENTIRHQQDLKNLIAEWRLVWRNYESQVRLLKVASENAQTSVEFAEQVAAMQKQLFLTGAAPSEKAQAAAHEVQQATAAAKYAKERLSALEAVAKDAPHLNPDNFDTQETLKTVITEADDNE